MASSGSDLASPRPRAGSDNDSSVDTMLASALQRNMSFTEDRKRQHTPYTANRPRRLRKAADLECEGDQKENNDPVAPNTKKVTPSRLACIKQLEQEMTCSVCLDICVRPCTTPCGHDFCRKCLKQALQHQRRCPKCRTHISTSAPICINTVLWNTIKLLFPKHAANAPESPADAILTPSAASNAAVVANAVAALPMQRGGHIFAPFNPPRRIAPQSLQQRPRRGAQRAPPSWLEGATRDSDPPISGRRHRLALSSQQQTMPQALGRWEAQPGAAQSSAGNAAEVVPSAAAAAGLNEPGQGYQAQLMQRAHSAQANRDAMPSLLENLQRRLDDLPVPDILHRPHGHSVPEVAAGLEASPRLRVRAFPQQPHGRQQSAPAARPYVRPQRVPTSQHQPSEGQGTSRQPHHPAAVPTWNSRAQSHTVHASAPASDTWLSDLPDTPEAPRAAMAAQRQAVADVLFEEAAGQSAIADSETVSEDPSWLDDAAAYDAAAAAAEVDVNLSELEILSDDDDTPVNGARSQARLNLSHLEHLMLLSDSEEEEEELSDCDCPAQPDRHGASARSPLSWTGRLPSGSTGLQQALDTETSQQAQGGADADPLSEPETALGHDGRPRVVLSDVTTRFPPEQLPQQLHEDAPSKPEDAAGSFQLQRRGRQPRACRSLLSGESDDAAAATSGAQSQADNSMPASSGAQGVSTLKTALRSSHKPQANASAASGSEGSGGTTAEGQTGICTRRQARLNKQSSQQPSQNSSMQVQQSQGDTLSDDDFAVLVCSQRPGKAVDHSSSSQSATGQGSSRNQAGSGDTQTGAGEQAFAIRRNRPRLQLNRKAKGNDGTSSDSQAATVQNALAPNAPQI